MQKVLAVMMLVSTVVFSMNYDIEFSFDSIHLTIHATQTVEWINELSEATSLAAFTLFPNLHMEENKEVSHIQRVRTRGRIDIEGVWVNGKTADFSIGTHFLKFPQKFSLSKTLLLVNLGREIKPGERVFIKLTFKLHFPKGLEDEGCMDGACVWRFGWYPIHVYIENGEYYHDLVYPPHTCHIQGRVPKGWRLVYHEGKGIGCPIAFLKGYEEYDLRGEKYEVRVFHKPGLKDKAMVVAAVALHALNVYTRRFGELDYGVINIIQSPRSMLFGITAPGFVVLGDGAFTSQDLIVPGFELPILEFLVYHEIAHLWFGVGTTVDFNKANFLSESLAQYASITQLEKERGSKINLYDPNVPDVFTPYLEEMFVFKSLREQYLYIYRRMHRSGLDCAVSGEANYMNQEFPRNYAKGYFAMRTLELYFDDFDAVLKRMHHEFDGKVMTYEKFRAFLESVRRGAGRVADELFLRKDGIDARVYRKGSEVIVDVPEGVPYEVLLVTNGSTEIVVETGKAVFKGVDEVHVDPYWRLPDPDRFNNHLPPLVDFSALSRNRTYSPLEAYNAGIFLRVLYMNDQVSYISLGMGVSKFDEWGASIGYGPVYTQVGTEVKVSNYIAEAQGYFSPNDYVLFSGNTMFSQTLYELNLQMGFLIPETLDIGYSQRYLATRNRIYGGVLYYGEWGGWGEYDFVDFVKFPLAMGIAAGGYMDGSFQTAAAVALVPTDWLGLEIQAEYGSNVWNLENSEWNGEGFAGLHLDLNFPRRFTALNLITLSGVHLELGGGYGVEGKDLSFEEGYPFLKLLGVIKTFSIFDTPSLFGIGYRIDFKEEVEGYLFFGVDVQSSVLASKNLGISLPSPLLKSRILPSRP